MEKKFISYQIMEKQFTTYEISKGLKNLGYKDITLTNFKENGELDLEIVYITGSKFWNIDEIAEIAAPTWQQATDFLESKGFYIVITPSHYDDLVNSVVFNCKLLRRDKEHPENYSSYSTNVRRTDFPTLQFESTYDARKTAILKVIEIINNKELQMDKINLKNFKNMKKIILLFAVAISLASCTSTPVIDRKDRPYIVYKIGISVSNEIKFLFK